MLYLLGMRVIYRTLLCIAAAVSMSQLNSGTAEANCGLDYCPLPEGEAKATKLGVLQLLVRHVEFSLPEGEGSYLESLMRVEVQRFENWRFGAWIAPVILDVNDESQTGFSNPVLFVERRQPVGDSTHLIGGLQLELPLGDSHNGIASGHTELLSYVGAIYEHSIVELQLQGGFATSLSEGHDHAGGNAIFVNPHEDQEAQIRAVGIVPLLKKTLRPGIFINSRSVIDDVDPRHFVTGGLSTTYRVTAAVSALAQVEVPLSTGQRFDWRAGVGVAYRL